MTTHHIANLIIISSTKSYADKLAGQIEERNFTALTSDVASAIDKVTTAHPDLILLHTPSDDLAILDLIVELKQIKKIAHIPTMVLVDEKTDEVYRKCHDVNADDVCRADITFEELLFLIKPLLRISTMYAELEARVKLAQSLGVPATSELINDSDSVSKILLVAPKDGDKSAIETALDGDCMLDVTTDYFEAEEMLTSGSYDACITHLDATNKEFVFSLASRVRNNPRLFNLPVLSLADEMPQDNMEAYRRGLTRLSPRPLSQANLRLKFQMLVKRQRLRWNIRKALATTQHRKLLDDSCQAYSKEFFNTHLTHQVDNAHKWQKHLTVVFFSIPNIPSIEQQFGEKARDHLLQQIYQWIASLTRVEDVVARFDDTEFCISLPDTPKDEALIVMHRIAGILSYTDFAVVDVFQPISVWVEVGISSLELGDSADNLVSKARKNID